MSDFTIDPDRVSSINLGEVAWPDRPRAKVPYPSFHDPAPVMDDTPGLMTDLVARAVQQRVQHEEELMSRMLSVIMDQLGIRQLIITPEELANLRPGVDVVRDMQGDQIIINRHQFD
jgi:hypothetical protein